MRVSPNIRGLDASGRDRLNLSRLNQLLVAHRELCLKCSSGLIPLLWVLCSTSLALCAESDSSSLWIQSHEARTWSGYKDNVLLSYKNSISSPLVGGGFDLMFFRLPADGWEYMFLVSADYVYYPSAREAEHEAVGFAQAQVKKTFDGGWRSGLSAEYLYFNQVFDSTVYQEEPGSIHVEGHSMLLRPSAGKDVGLSYRLDLEVPVGRQEFAEFIDDFWEAGPKLILSREYGRKSQLSASYQFTQRLHDSREARDTAGGIISGQLLEFSQHEAGLGWRHFWDQQQRWRTVARVGLQRNSDNAGGYYDFVRPQIFGQLRYQLPGWELRAEGRGSHYLYDHQRVAEVHSPKRERTILRLTVRGEKTVKGPWKAFAQYEHERAWGNLELDRYIANTISAGIAYGH
jgi:hypothetical protein